MADRIHSYKDLHVYQNAMNSAMEIFTITKNFPSEERYSLTDQIRRSSRSVPANLAEAWRKRRYEKAFIAKLSDCEAEAAETQVWLDFAHRCGYISSEKQLELDSKYEIILFQIIKMINNTNKWLIT
ncbi:MAG: four helix bundle protein [Victivallaceae bacterium]|nr:four helix bundle protein [Victivallaceae bacterium]